MMKVLQLLVWMSLLQMAIYGYVVEVLGGEEECFIEYVKTKRTAYLRIAVLRGEGQDIRLKAYGPFDTSPSMDVESQQFFNQMVTTSSNDQDDTLHDGFNFETEHRGGYYKYCLDNKHTTWHMKTVDFSTSHGLTNENEQGHEDEKEQVDKQAHIMTVNESLDRTKALLRLIRSEQSYYGKREKRHMETINSSQSRLWWYTIAEIVMLGGIYAGQNYLLKQWFSDRDSGRQWA